MARDRKEAQGPQPAVLPFEQPIEDVRQRLEELETLAQKTNQDLTEELDFYRARLDRVTRETYASLSAWDRVQVARHPDRPLATDYIALLLEDWVELHGDGCFGDDRAIVTGLGTLGRHRLMLVGHRKGRDTKARMACNFGSAHPEGYRKALRKMKLAERMGLPILSLVNTPGAYPGVGAEERGQARAIAENILEMFGIRVPIVVVVIGEGGSGGALGIAVGDRVGMLENAWYSVISPEGCASILWRSAERKAEAAEALKLTAGDLHRLGIVDEVLPEPVGGAHRHREETVRSVGRRVEAWLDELSELDPGELLRRRQHRFRTISQTASDLEAALAAAEEAARREPGPGGVPEAPEPPAAPEEPPAAGAGGPGGEVREP